MAERTETDLVNEAAAILGIKTPAEALSEEDFTTIKDCVDPVLFEVDDIVTVDRDHIPERFFQTLARLVAIQAAPKFSNAPVAMDQIQVHEQRLRFLADAGPTYQTLRGEYF